jgi:hypothetical protein
MRSIPLNSSAGEVLDQLGTGGNSEHLFINVQTKARLTAANKVWGTGDKVPTAAFQA